MSGRPLDLPPLEGQLRRKVRLAPLTWMRVGGVADAVANPASVASLGRFLAALDPAVPLLPLGVASNLLVRDGGIEGVVLRLGGPMAEIEIEGTVVIAGAGVLDQRLAQSAARASLTGLEFMIGVPGTIGGAVCMNAGAFGSETADRLLWVEAMDRTGRRHRLRPQELGLAYRHSALPAGWIVLRAAFDLAYSDPDRIRRRMQDIRAEREAAQPVRVATGGSTFKNPPGASAWQLIDQAGCRGLRHGRAMMSPKHCNFMINTGDATAAELETLGETVRRRVQETSGIRLDWEIVRIGRQQEAEVSA